MPLSQTLRDAIRHESAGSGSYLPSFTLKLRVLLMKLLGRRGRGGYVLRLMHETGFLARFVPEFGRISLLIQHDLYHHYTAG